MQVCIYLFSTIPEQIRSRQLKVGEDNETSSGGRLSLSRSQYSHSLAQLIRNGCDPRRIQREKSRHVDLANVNVTVKAAQKYKA